MTRALRWIAYQLPFRPCARWRWWRRATGGRWARKSTTGLWYLVPQCPGTVDAILVGIGVVPPADYEAHRRCCTCEVWP